MIELVNQIFGGLVLAATVLKVISSRISNNDDKNEAVSDQNENKQLKIDSGITETNANNYRRLKLQYFPAYFAAISS